MLAELIPKIAGFDKQEHDFYPRPSLAGPERCLRQMVYRGLKMPKDKEIGDRFILTMDDSSWHEELTLDWLRKSAYKIHSQQMKVPCLPPMKEGSIDGILTDIEKNDYVLEHKAINHFSFEAIENGRMPVDYLTQLAIYMEAIIRAINSEVKKGVLLIKNKNTSQYLEFIVEYDIDKDILTIKEIVNSTKEERQYPNTQLLNIVNEACAKFNLVLDYISKQTLPKRPFGLSQMNSYPCTYCLWQDSCWKGYEEEFNKLVEGVELTQDAEDLCGHYLELNMHINEMEKEKDEHKNKIKALMAEKQAKTGRVGEYLVSLRLQSKESINKDNPMPEELKAKYIKVNQYEVINIKKPVKKEKKNGKL